MYRRSSSRGSVWASQSKHRTRYIRHEQYTVQRVDSRIAMNWVLRSGLSCHGANGPAHENTGAPTSRPQPARQRETTLDDCSPRASTLVNDRQHKRIAPSRRTTQFRNRLRKLGPRAPSPPALPEATPCAARCTFIFKGRVAQPAGWEPAVPVRIANCERSRFRVVRCDGDVGFVVALVVPKGQVAHGAT